jgi:DNA-binding PadR family transcriptional regulator
LNNLESQGFVIRSQAKDDKRVVNLTLSDKGREALRQRRSDMELNISRLAEHLGEENTEIFINLLTKTSDFYQNSENSDDESMMGFSNRRKRHHEKYHRENEEKNSMKESRQRADEDGS